MDSYGDQCESKWLFVLCPEIEKILNKRHIPALHLNPRATFNFLSKIEENGAYFVLVKEDLIPLLGSNVEEPWLQSWKFQIHTIDQWKTHSRNFDSGLMAWLSGKWYFFLSMIRVTFINNYRITRFSKPNDSKRSVLNICVLFCRFLDNICFFIQNLIIDFFNCFFFIVYYDNTWNNVPHFYYNFLQYISYLNYCNWFWK